jgi:hypothetical protein
VEQKSTHGLATDLIGDPNGTKLDGDIYEFAYVRSQTEPAGLVSRPMEVCCLSISIRLLKHWL